MTCTLLGMLLLLQECAIATTSWAWAAVLAGHPGNEDTFLEVHMGAAEANVLIVPSLLRHPCAPAYALLAALPLPSPQQHKGCTEAAT
jgi:hypothetical protein